LPAAVGPAPALAVTPHLRLPEKKRKVPALTPPCVSGYPCSPAPPCVCRPCPTCTDDDDDFWPSGPQRARGTEQSPSRNRARWRSQDEARWKAISAPLPQPLADPRPSGCRRTKAPAHPAATTAQQAQPPRCYICAAARPSHSPQNWRVTDAGDVPAFSCTADRAGQGRGQGDCARALSARRSCCRSKTQRGHTSQIPARVTLLTRPTRSNSIY
jgi:hypothetical protein